MIKHHDAYIRESAAAGLSIKETAVRIGAHYQTVYLYARAHGIKFRHASTKTEPDARATTMRDLYLGGSTLQDIGDRYGMTRERVRQIITKHYGRLRKEGGISKTAKDAAAIRRAEHEARSKKKWGCSWAQYRLLRFIGFKEMKSGCARERTPLGAYARQKANANKRGIGWEFNLWQWWTVWQKSGKWPRRGRTKGKFVMARHGDIGPYSESNVSIIPAFQNCHEGTSKSGMPVGVVARKSGRFTAKTMSGGKIVHLGTYDTADEAHLAYLKSIPRAA